MAVKPTEIRLGNFFKDVTIRTIGLTSVTGDDNNMQIGYDELIPIALTPQILSNSGFTAIDSQTYRKEYLFVYFQNGYFNVRVKRPNGIIPAEYRYVHQFQNLYFAITGQEIEVHLMK